MKLTLPLLALVGLSLGNPCGYAQHPVQNGVAVTEKASPADNFVDTIGVNTHITYTQSNYANFSAVLQALQELGVRHIRDGYQPTSAWGTTYPGKSPYYADHRALANAGIHTNYLVNCFVNGALPSASDIVAFARLAGDMDAIEAANEPDDNSGCVQTGATVWQTNVAAQLGVLHTAASTLKVPLYGPAMVNPGAAGEIGNQSANVTDCNIHFYSGGRQPEINNWGSAHGDPNGYGYAGIQWWIDQDTLAVLNGYAQGRPCVITETGFFAFPTTSTPYQVTEAVEAIYFPRTLMAAYAWGIRRTYVFELMEYAGDPLGYGLLRSDNSPKPAFMAVKNLIATLSDPGTTQFYPGYLKFEITGSTTNVQHFLFQKRDGSFWLALWNSSPVYNPSTNQEISVPSQNVTLTLFNAYKAQTLQQLDETGGMSSANLAAKTTASLNVTSGVSLVKITP
jgi:hypothetical protein